MSKIYIHEQTLQLARTAEELPPGDQVLVTSADELGLALSAANLVKLAESLGKKANTKQAKVKIAALIWPDLEAKLGKPAKADKPRGEKPPKADRPKMPKREKLNIRYKIAKGDPGREALINEHGKLIIGELARLQASTTDGCFGKAELKKLRASHELLTRLNQVKATKQKIGVIVAHWLHYLKRWGFILENRPPKTEGSK